MQCWPWILKPIKKRGNSIQWVWVEERTESSGPTVEIQPEIYQIKKSGQPVKFEMVDSQKGVVRITNYHHFKNLSELAGSWELSADGKVVQSGKLDVELPAQQTKEIVVPFDYFGDSDFEERILTISFQLKESTNWAEAGHEVAWEQFNIPPASFNELQVEQENSIETAESDSIIQITGGNFRYQLNKQTGQFVSLQYNGTEYLEGGPAFQVWRAPLANDIDPWGSQNFSERNFTPGLGRSIDNQLRTLGMRDLIPQVDNIQIDNKSDSFCFHSH